MRIGINIEIRIRISITTMRIHDTRAAIQRRGSILAWTVILSVYGVDTIAIDLSLSALIS
jgi:hypothetical protein